MTPTEQSYAVYRALLTAEERAELSRSQPSIVLADIAFLWLQIVSAWAIAWTVPWLTIIAAIVVGNRYYALYIIGHDGLHRRLHPHPKVNDLINDCLILGPVGAITRVNRWNHMEHHRTLGAPIDPDRFKYQSRAGLSSLSLAFSFTGFPLVLRAFRNVFFPSTGARVERRDGASYETRDLTILLAWQAALVGGLTYAFGWWGYPVLWLAPVAACTVCMDLLRVFVEHSVDKDDAGASPGDRLIMVVSSPVEALIFAPKNMNHHVAHHVWPTIPYFNLPLATALLESRSVSANLPFHKRRGYCTHLFHCLSVARLRRRMTSPVQ